MTEPRLLLAALACTLAGAGLAAVPEVPEGCAPLATAHKESCALSQVYDCEGNRLVIDFEKGAMVQQAFYDSEWSLLEYQHFDEGAPVLTITALEGSNMEMTQLIAAGAVETKATMEMSTGVSEGREYAYRGTAELTGETEVIGGTEYLRARITRDLTLNEELPGMSFRLDALIDPERNLLIEGAWERVAFGGAVERFAQAVRAILAEGDPGFLEIRPEDGCE